MGSSQAAPHVVIVPNCLPGHAIPILRFARSLASAGVVTTIVSTDRHVRDLQQEETSTLTELRIVPLGDKTSLDLSYKEWLLQRIHGDRSAEVRLVELLESTIRSLGPPLPVCIVCDMFEMWTQEVADRLQIQKHLLYVSCAAALSCTLQAERLRQQGLVPITRASRERVFSDIPGLPPTAALDLPQTFWGSDLSHRRISRCRLADVILLNTFYDLETTVLNALRKDVVGSQGVRVKSFLDVGPLLPEGFVKEEDEEARSGCGGDPCIDWLNTRGSKSVLYVSFGSEANHSAEQLLELAEGLEASGVSFLWIVRPPGAPGLYAAASTASVSVTEFLPVGFQERVKERGLCYSQWAPQLRILKHPAVGGFLSHCGWNSTLETVCAGVPVLTWPKFAEQSLNRRFMVDTVKAAIELKENPYTKEQLESDEVKPLRFVSKEEIEKKARSLMLEPEGEIVRENVRKLKMKAREAAAPGGSARQNFEAYVRLLESINHPS